MRIILTLTVSGSIILLFILVFQCYIRKYGLFKWQDLLIRISLGFYLIPLPVLKVLLNGIRKETGGMKAGEVYGNSDGSIQILHDRISALKTDNMLVISAAFQVYLIITGIALVTAASFFLRELYKYRKLKRMISSPILIKELYIKPEPVEELLKKLHMKNRPKVYVDLYGLGALSMGVSQPIIVVPGQLKEDRLEAVLLHELCHIKRRDMLVKFFVTLAVCIHWFNPLLYFLPGMFNRNCELCCDNMVLQYSGKEIRGAYARQIVEMASGDGRSIPTGSVGFCKKSNFTEERIMNIMKERNKIKGIKLITAFLSAFLLCAAAMPVYAYEMPPVLSIGGDCEAVETGLNGIHNGDAQFHAGEQNHDALIIRFDNQFVDGDGNIYNTDVQALYRCDHSEKTAGNFQTHVKNKDGSCVTKTWKADRCALCGDVLIGEFVSELKYAHCPH